MRAKTVIIHMGLAKTGSTSIQKFLGQNQTRLADQGFLYPSLNEKEKLERRALGFGRGPHSDLARSLMRSGAMASEDVASEDVASEQEWKAWVDTFAEFRQSTKYHTLIISNETLGMSAATLEFERLREQIQDYRIRILFYLRHTETWLASLYDQSVQGKARLACLPERFVTETRLSKRSFETIAEAVIAAFPGAELEAVAFEQVVRSEGLLPHFAKFVGLSRELQAAAGDTPEVNIGLQRDQITFLFHCNRLDINRKAFTEIRRAFGIANIGLRREESKRVSIFSRSSAEAIDRRYRRDLAFVRAKLGADLPRFDPLPQAEDPEWLRLRPETIERLCQEALPLLSLSSVETFDKVAAAIGAWEPPRLGF